ncbi:hypothetical protein BBI01_18535 [Chryseobacterium artocarpi]|uniref:Uncharacterized protein n=1 Tax=Chryseobacterium artocarpi TaxID=1414727 RepID=A0A1B8ZA24_9FLAO|nr:hypothetical protein BBI01_18535 [Chryseobacterium artocarpi]
MNTKLTLEDLKLESFLTEIDNSKLVKVQGGNGAYEDNSEDCDTVNGACETATCMTYVDCAGTYAECDETLGGGNCPSLTSNDCDGGSGEVQC